MTDNFDSNKKLTPYKEIVKKRALEYYCETKKAISEKRKEKYRQMLPEVKKSLLSITNNGLIDKRLKDSENYKKKHENIIKIDMIICWCG